METMSILAVDDHKMTVMGYKYILEDAEFDGFKVEMDIATTFDLAKQKIEQSARGQNYDLLLLDIQLTPLNSKDSRTGEDLGILARSILKETQIVFMSSFSDALRIQSIFKSVSPDGYMVKSEIDERTLFEMIKTVKRRDLYYSASALVVMSKTMSQPFEVDENDKKILLALSRGTKTKDISNLVPAFTGIYREPKTSTQIEFWDQRWKWSCLDQRSTQ